MTNDQWNRLEEMLNQSDGLVQQMFNAPKGEMDDNEFVRLNTALMCCTDLMDSLLNSNSKLTQEDLEQFVASVERLMMAMYGRMLGLARHLDRAITKQVQLEAELATTGK